MVVFVDLESDDEEPSSASFYVQYSKSSGSIARSDVLKHGGSFERDSVRNGKSPKASIETERNGCGFAAVLTCYPVALSLSSHLDLNDLYALSLTCQSIHASLSQFSHQLISYSLRCINDDQPTLTDLIAMSTEHVDLSGPGSDGRTGTHQNSTSALPSRYAQIAAAIQGWPYISEEMDNQLALFSKTGACAHDLVAPCRKCGTVVCRNCAAKAPSDRFLEGRFRRLCRACLEAPITAHFKPLTECQEASESPPGSSASSTRSQRSISGSSDKDSTVVDVDYHSNHKPFFTATAFDRDPCTCASRGVFLCTPCGHNLRASDITYKRVWTWRSRYSTHIGGGLGTGLGEGNQGQKCGRGDQCLERGTAGVCWVEIDCSEAQPADQEREWGSSSRTGTPTNDLHTPDHLHQKPGYLRQEIEGIGGVVKKKVRKRVKVGATVWEYDDERESGRYLEREAKGQERSWCGWCSRVCLGQKDRELLA